MDLPSATRRFDVSLKLSALGILSALNKHIKIEAKGFFWSKLKFKLRASVRLRDLLDSIGPQGRANIQEIQFDSPKPGDIKHGREAAESFQQSLQLLKECENIQSLTLCFSAANLFYMDAKPMRRFFKSGQRLKSPALTEFRDVLASLPKLKTINLTGKACVTRDGCPCCEYLHWEDDQFFRFAFTGERQEKLCTEMALYLMKRFVYCPPMSLLVNDQKSKKRVAQAKRNGKAIFTIEWPLLRMDQTQDLEMMTIRRGWKLLMAVRSTKMTISRSSGESERKRRRMRKKMR